MISSASSHDEGAASSLVAGVRLLLGVSLANRAFSAEFCRTLGQWLNVVRPLSLEVLFFDACEALNYMVFRGMQERPAMERALLRAKELQRCFQRNLGQHYQAVTMTLESTLVGQYQDLAQERLRCITATYLKGTTFRDDVHEQVRVNLVSRNHGPRQQFVDDNIERIAQYVLRELMVFDICASTNRMDVEIYPGHGLFVKNRMWCGAYDGLRNPLIVVPPVFLDITSVLTRSTVV